VHTKLTSTHTYQIAVSPPLPYIYTRTHTRTHTLQHAPVDRPGVCEESLVYFLGGWPREAAVSHLIALLALLTLLTLLTLRTLSTNLEAGGAVSHTTSPLQHD
jgi:hypothetical protein